MEAPKQLIIYVVFGVVALLILGGLSTGTGAWTYNLQNTNSSTCTNYNGSFGVSNCTAISGNNASITSIAGTVVPIIFFAAIILKLL